jgi:hypothetical protein
MSETGRDVNKSSTSEQEEKYFSFQIKGWTNFDPMDKTLARIADGIEQGGGFLTLMEVVRVEDELASIGDEEVRECFANILAAKRLLQNVHGLPKKLIEDLRSALNTEGEQEVVRKKTVASVASSPANHEPGSRVASAPLSQESGSRARPWP